MDEDGFEDIVLHPEKATATVDISPPSQKSRGPLSSQSMPKLATSVSNLQTRTLSALRKVSGDINAASMSMAHVI